MSDLSDSLNQQPVAGDGGFSVWLQRRGRRVPIPPGETILDCLLALNLDLAYSCQQGVCGTCETRVLAGTPDHQDMVLSEAEQAAGDRIMICCSRAKTAQLVLDL